MRRSAAGALREESSPGARLAVLVLSMVALPASHALGHAEAPRRVDTVTAHRPDSLRFELVAPAEVRVGEPVPITLRLTNGGERPLELHLLGRTVAFDIVIAGADGAVVWRRLEGQAVQGILQLKILAPAETLELSDVWHQRDGAGRPVPPGTYTLQGVLPTDEPRPLRTPEVRLRITPS